MTQKTPAGVEYDNVEKTDRNAAMLADLKDGMSQVKTAKKYNITRQRVMQFVRKWKAEGLLA